MPEYAPTISCVINNFNYENHVGQAIASALAQTSPFDQVIVVDDGSTDGSLEVIGRYCEDVTVVAIENSGQTGACLQGLARVTSDYVYFLDADDFLAPNMVETIRGTLGGWPVKIQFQLTTVDIAGRSLNTSFPTFSGSYGTPEMLEDNRIIGFYRSPPTSGNVVRADVLASIDPAAIDPRGAIDGTLNLILPYFGSALSLNQPLAFRRVHDHSLGQWSRPSVDVLEKEIRLFERSWLEALGIMGWPSPPYRGREPLYLLERSMMIDALRGKTILLWPVSRFVIRLLQSRQPARQKLLLAAWSLSLLWPNRAFRENAIRARRSPVNRSGRLDRFVRRVISPSA
jgi:hypothetical protein